MLDVKREISSFGLFAPNLPATAAGAMVEYIKAETDPDACYPLNGVTVHFKTCGVQFLFAEPYDAEDEDDDEDDDDEDIYTPARICVHIRGLIPNRRSSGTYVELCSNLCAHYRWDEATGDGLIRLIQRIKPIIANIEKRGFCSCPDWPPMR